MDNIKKVILDTDMGSDCDDAGALAMLHNLEKAGKAEILAVTHCATEIGGAVTIKVINNWYGKDNIPIGRNEGTPFLEEDCCKVYTTPVMQEYLKSNSMPEFENSVKLMRRVLSQNKDVTLISIGILNNYAALLASLPDEISPLSGYDLINQSVKEMYVMGGNFKEAEHAEYNISTDIKAAQYIIENFPKPIVYCGFELGADVSTGAELKKQGADNPVKKIYSIYSENGLRESWDPITVYAAIETENRCFEKSDAVKISFDNSGKTVFADGGKDYYIIRKVSAEEVCDEIDRLIV